MVSAPRACHQLLFLSEVVSVRAVSVTSAAQKTETHHTPPTRNRRISPSYRRVLKLCRTGIITRAVVQNRTFVGEDVTICGCFWVQRAAEATVVNRCGG